MTESTLWTVIIVSGILTFGLRLSFIYLFGRVDAPPMLQRALKYVPVAVLPALVLPSILVRDGTLDLTLGNQRLIAGVVAAVVAWSSKSVLLTIAVGMICLWILQGFG
jgi:branched-subunit amino acid transport protein